MLLAGTAAAFDRCRPGPDYRHLVRKADLERFNAVLPDWDELASGFAGSCSMRRTETLMGDHASERGCRPMALSPDADASVAVVIECERAVIAQRNG